MTIFDRTIGLLERAMDLRGTRQRIIASNVANEETPGYRAKEFDLRTPCHKRRMAALPFPCG